MWLSKGTFKHLIIVLILFSIQALANNAIQKFYPVRPVVDREGRPWRLPNTTYPLKYHLHITTWIHREIYNFTGNVTIELFVKENTSELVLHARDLTVQRFFVQDLKAKQKIENLKSRIVDDLLIIEANGTKNFVFIKNHRLRLEIHYTGVIKSNGYGFTKMTYQDDKNNTIYGAYTNSQPMYAREVLPCYDEPALRANFTVRITHDSSYTAISNMPAISTLDNGSGKMTTTSFMETPLMSTYLLVFVVSNYKFIARESNGTMQRVFLPPNSKNPGNLALSNAVEVLELLAQYLEVPYTLPKLDHISIKEHGGGMENWGLITYGEGVFIDENLSDAVILFEMDLQSHEIVHQWFGNLVSPEWWNSVWLSEGFALYYSHLVMTKVRPGSTLVDRVALGVCQKDVIYEHLMSIGDYVEGEEILLKFGSTAYVKAPCIIQMFEHAFGEPVFRKGVSNYLKERAFSTANENHLYDHLQAALLESPETSWNYSVHEMMRPWLHAKTLPIVTITRDYNNSNIIHIQQKPSVDDVEELWWIPLNFATASQPNFESTKPVYYMPPIASVTLNLNEFNITLNDEDWILANIQSTGLYRVIYDNENLLRLTKALKVNCSVIHEINREVLAGSISTECNEKNHKIASNMH